MSSNVDVLKQLICDKRVALHYNDEYSVNPEDYAKTQGGKKSMKLLQDFCSSGAIVGADFRKLDRTSMLVGEISSGSEIQAIKYGKFVYKTVQMKNVKRISYTEHPLLSAIQPRQATITGWPSAQRYLESILYDKKVPRDVNNLHPSQLEVICYEYLLKIGVIEALLLPIGRTIPDIDIHGFNKEGEIIYAQVTYAGKKKDIEKKKERLKKYAGKKKIEKTKLFFFGPEKMVFEDELVNYVSIQDVFFEFDSKPGSLHYNMLSKMLGR